VLDMFAQMYQAGGQNIDMHATTAPGHGLAGRVQALAEKAAHWYVERAQRKAAGR